MEHHVANITVALSETTLQKVENKTRHKYHCNPRGLKVTTKVLVQSGRLWKVQTKTNLQSLSKRIEKSLSKCTALNKTAGVEVHVLDKLIGLSHPGMYAQGSETKSNITKTVYG